MTIAKWSAVSFFGLGSALLMGSMAATGCSVTSTGVNDDGGPGPVITNPETDSGTDTGALSCPNNTKETITPLVSADCQARLDVICCNELVNCFDITPTDTTKTQDCNQYITCLDRCNFGTSGTVACTTDAECTAEAGSACEPEADGTKKCEAPVDDTTFMACKMDCQALTQDDVIMNEESLEVCIKTDPTANTACNGAP